MRRERTLPHHTHSDFCPSLADLQVYSTALSFLRSTTYRVGRAVATGGLERALAVLAEVPGSAPTWQLQLQETQHSHADKRASKTPAHKTKTNY